MMTFWQASLNLQNQLLETISGRFQTLVHDAWALLMLGGFASAPDLSVEAAHEKTPGRPE